MQRARFGSVGFAAGVTANQVLNSVFVNRAHESFRVPERYIAVTNRAEGLAMELVARDEARVLFDGPHDVERWDVRRRHDEVELECWTFAGEPERAAGESPPAANELLVMLAMRRGNRVRPVHERHEWKADDLAFVAVYRNDAEEAHRVLRAWGFIPAESESEEEAAAVAD